MRLGQLARKINTKTSQIVSFLEKEKNVILNIHPNSKIPDAFIDEIILHFQPKPEKKNLLPKTQEPVEEKIEKVTIPVKNKVIEKETPVEKPTTITPKIIGKIDLPDKSKIEIELDGVVYTEEALEQKKKAEREHLKALKEKEAQEKKELKRISEEKNKKERERKLAEALRLKDLATKEKNILSAEDEKKQRAKEKEKAKHQEKLKQKAKEAKKLHYEKRVTKQKPVVRKIKQPTKPILKEEDNLTFSEMEQKEVLNFLQRFLKWLNS
ncbi:MAG: hypothetical protein K0B10_10170 [Vicingaceae bacterium]|nr:hypothetical protein [Vicingaceae bacterium]